MLIKLKHITSNLKINKLKVTFFFFQSTTYLQLYKNTHVMITVPIHFKILFIACQLEYFSENGLVQCCLGQPFIVSHIQFASRDSLSIRDWQHRHRPHAPISS